MYFHFETFVQKIYQTFAIFLVEIYVFLIVCVSSLICSENFHVFSHVLIFTIRAFRLISGVLTFAKFLKFLKRGMVREGRCFLIFQPNYMLNYCLNMNNAKPVYAYRHYA